jgi:hypothetical protein
MPRKPLRKRKLRDYELKQLAVAIEIARAAVVIADGEAHIRPLKFFLRDAGVINRRGLKQTAFGERLMKIARSK